MFVACNVDDFIIAIDQKDRRWKTAKRKIFDLYKWGKWESKTFTLCGVRYLQKDDYSVVMDQQEFTRKLFNADFHLPKKPPQTEWKG